MTTPRTLADPSPGWCVSRSCTVAVGDDDSPCGQPVPVDAPISVCAPHLISAFRYCQGLLPPERDVTWIDRIVVPSAEWRKIRGPVVYYARIDPYIKIGMTADMVSRMSALRVTSVLALEPGGYEVESRRHAQFAASRVEARDTSHFATKPREWFHPTDELRDHILALRGITEG